MKNTHFFAVLFLLSLLVSCVQKRDSSEHPSDVLAGTESKFSSYRYDQDLVDELFEELKKESEELKALEKDLEALDEKWSSKKDPIADYLSKSQSYYSSAESKLGSIQDTVLREKIQVKVERSNTAFALSIAEIEQLRNQISLNRKKLDDLYMALKIVLTLPVIEKFQKDEKPATTELKEQLQQQQDLLLKLETMLNK